MAIDSMYKGTVEFPKSWILDKDSKKDRMLSPIDELMLQGARRVAQGEVIITVAEHDANPKRADDRVVFPGSGVELHPTVKEYAEQVVSHQYSTGLTDVELAMFARQYAFGMMVGHRTLEESLSD